MAWEPYTDPSTGQTWYKDNQGNYTQDSTEYDWQEYLRSQSDAAQQDRDLERYSIEGQLGLGYARIAADNARSAAELAESKRQFDIQWNTLSAKDREQFAWLRESFYAELEEKQRQFNLGLAESMLGTSAQLRGPADWLSYAQYTSGGRDIFQQLFGNEPAPAFGAPTGYSKAMDITDLLKALGITQIPGAGGGALPDMTNEAALDWIFQNRPDIGEFYAKNGWQVGTPEQNRAIVMNWIQQGDPQWKGMTSRQVAEKLGYKAPQQPVAQGFGPVGPSQQGTPVVRGDEQVMANLPRQYRPQRPPPGATDIGNAIPPGGIQPTPQPIGRMAPQNPAQIPEGPSYKGGPIGDGGQTGQPNPSAPLPHQINPAVWDALSNTAKAMILAAAEKGYTPSGAWTAEDYLRGINQARPRGNAPRRVGYQWGGQKPLY